MKLDEIRKEAAKHDYSIRKNRGEAINWWELVDGINRKFNKNFTSLKDMIRYFYPKRMRTYKLSKLLGVSDTTLRNKMNALNIKRVRGRSK